jgi:anti-sigma factor RsiW
MTCEDAHLHMHDYISGELAREHHKPLMDHLDSCPNCKKFFLQTQQMRTTVRNAMRQEVPTDLQNAIHSILANA